MSIDLERYKALHDPEPEPEIIDPEFHALELVLCTMGAAAFVIVAVWLAYQLAAWIA